MVMDSSRPMDFSVFAAFRLRPLLGTVTFSCLVAMLGAPLSEPKCRLIRAFLMSPCAQTTIESKTLWAGTLYSAVCFCCCCIRVENLFIDFCIIVEAIELKLMCSILNLAFIWSPKSLKLMFNKRDLLSATIKTSGDFP